MPILEACDVHYAYETHRVLRGVSPLWSGANSTPF